MSRNVGFRDKARPQDWVRITRGRSGFHARKYAKTPPGVPTGSLRTESFSVFMLGRARSVNTNSSTSGSKPGPIVFMYINLPLNSKQGSKRQRAPRNGHFRNHNSCPGRPLCISTKLTRAFASSQDYAIQRSAGLPRSRGKNGSVAPARLPRRPTT